MIHAGSVSSWNSPQKPNRATHSSATSCFAGLTGFLLFLGAGGAFTEAGDDGSALGARVVGANTGSGGARMLSVCRGSVNGVIGRSWSGGLVGRIAFRGDGGGVIVLGTKN